MVEGDPSGQAFGNDENNLVAYRRAQDVLNVEIPNWWSSAHHALAAAVSGRSWTAMTVAQIEACVAHLESLAEGPIRYPGYYADTALAGTFRARNVIEL